MIITSDRSTITVQIKRAELTRIGTVPALALLTLNEPTNSGDWGGAEYPKYDVADTGGTLIAALVDALRFSLK